MSRGLTRKILKARKAFSLIELLVAISIFSMLTVVVIISSIQALQSVSNVRRRFKSQLLLVEVSNAIIANKNDFWKQITDITDTGVKHLELVDSSYIIMEGSIIQAGSEIGFTVTSVYRDELDNIVDSGGELDLHTRKITVTVSWKDVLGKQKTAVSYFFVNDWNISTWVQTTVADFSQGTFNDTKVATVSNGELSLIEIFYPDWCNPQIALNSYDLPGNAEGNGIMAFPGHVFIGTGENASSVAFMHLLVDNGSPPTVTVDGTFDGHKTNDLDADAIYAYLATDTNEKEAVVVDLTYPYTEVGYFDAYRSYDGIDVQVNDDSTVGFLAQAYWLRSFDLSTKTGSRPQLDVLGVAASYAYITDLVFANNYMFVSMYNDWDEVAIVDVSNPYDMREIGYADVNTAQSTRIHVSDDTNRLYMGTNTSTSYNEFFIVDTTTKYGQQPVIGSYDTNGTSVKGVVVIDDRAIVGGTGGEEYQVLDVSDETNPIYCGGLQMDYGIFDMELVKYGNELYSYVLTGDPVGEFKIIRGGPGGGDENGNGYAEVGTYVSPIFDTTSENPTYYYIEWDQTLPAGTAVEVQIRTGDSSDLSAVGWYGPDGTALTYFSDPKGESVPEIAQGGRYFQYKLVFRSDTIETPTIEEVRLGYQK